MKVETFAGILVLFLVDKAFPAEQIPDVGVKLPFSDLLGLDALNIEGFSEDNSGADQDLLLNLPFSDLGLPFLPNILSALPKRPVVRLNGPGVNGGGGQNPLSVINMPFAKFKLPLASVTEARQKLPNIALAELSAARLKESRDSPLGSRSVLPPDEDSGEAIVAKGNLDTVHETYGPKGGVSPEFPNQLSLPLSIMNFPMNSIQTPLSHFSLPFSNLGADGAFPLDFLIKGPRQIRAEQTGQSREYKTAFEAETPSAAGKQSQPPHPNDLAAQTAEALSAPNAVNLNSFSMPYSFLNNPLSFFNAPLAFLNLPYGSSNLPLAHINLPFSFFNLPLFEMFQTFGGPPLPLGKSFQETPSPLDSTDLFRSSFQLDATEETADASKSDPLESLKKDPVLKGLSSFFTGFQNVSADTSSFEKPSHAIRLADGLMGSAFSGGKADPSNLMRSLGSVLKQSGVPAVPQLGGLFGTENSVFTTPFSFFNTPLGFADMPVGFMNLPMSHFNLPLSHLSLPFANLALPLNDIATPELDQTVETASVELADIPPSLLQITNPDNTLNAYLNLPLAEMNLPLAVMDMPFTVFDMPFAFLNLPLAHFNNPLTHLHLPFEISSLPLANVGLPFQQFIDYFGF